MYTTDTSQDLGVVTGEAFVDLAMLLSPYYRGKTVKYQLIRVSIYLNRIKLCSRE